MKPLAVALALLLAACASGDVWVKEGATAADLDRDTQACERSARIAAEREAFRGVPAAPPQVRVERGGAGSTEIVRGGSSTSLDESALRAQYFDRCMREMGYKLQPAPKG